MRLDVVKRFTAAVNKSLSYAAEHPDETRAVLTTYTKIDQETAAKLVLPRWTPEIDAASTNAVADELVPSEPDVAALLP